VRNDLHSTYNGQYIFSQTFVKWRRPNFDIQNHLSCRLRYQLQEVKHSVTHISINSYSCVSNTPIARFTWVIWRLSGLQGLLINNSNNTNSLDRCLLLEHLLLWELPGFELFLIAETLWTMLLSTKTKRSLC
jgi:hypothetical protein